MRKPSKRDAMLRERHLGVNPVVSTLNHVTAHAPSTTHIPFELEFAFRVNYLYLASNKNNEEGFCVPEVGDLAPDFELPSNMEKGKKVKLSDFRGKKNVVLAFYPLAFTPV